jgi:adenylate kinase family enzyme
MIDLNKIKIREESYPFQIKLEKSLQEELKKYCKKEKIYTGALVGELIKEYLKQHSSFDTTTTTEDKDGV